MYVNSKLEALFFPSKKGDKKSRKITIVKNLAK